MTLAPGTTVGRYQILEPLGQGGMATVYKAFQPSLQREVALKVLRPGYAQDQEFRERFEREAIAIAKLRHPHIVQVFDFEIASSGEYMLAMEFLEGGTLKDRLANLAEAGRGLEPRDTVRVVSEVADALGYAHKRGIIHRDVKPSNVMLTEDGRAVVTDFGIARILGATSHTQTGVGIGTPEYMAPEQGQGSGVDHRADIYSLGAMAYELLVGRVPYSADTPLAVVLAHIKDPLPLPSKVNPTIGPGVEKALLTALAKDPSQRYEQAMAFAEALRDGLAADSAGGTMPTVVVRAGAAAPAAPVRAAAAPARQIRLSVPPVLAQRRAMFAVAGALVIAVVAGTVVTSNALRGLPVASGAPTTAAEAAKVPARGALIWQAKLDGTEVDARDTPGGPPGSDPADARVRFVPGAIEYVLDKASSTTSRVFNLNAPGRETFVIELDVDPIAAFSLTLNWWEADQQRYGLSASVRSGRMQFEYSKPLTAGEPITQSVLADALRRGNRFTLAVVVERDRFTAFVDGREILRTTPDGRVPPAAIPVKIGMNGAEPGTFRLTGIRLYELPSSAVSASAAPALAPLTSVPKGKLVWDAKLDGATNDIGAQDVGPPPNAKPSDVAVRQVKGAIEVEIRTANIGAGIYPNTTARDTYVFDLDAVAAQGSLTVYARQAVGGYPGVGVRVGTGTLQLTYRENASSTEEPLTPPHAAAIQVGSPFSLSLVVEETRYSAFLAGKLIAQATDSRIKGAYLPRIFYSGPASSVFRMTGLRMYEIGSSSPVSIGPAVGTSPAVARDPAAIPPVGPPIVEVRMDGTGADFRPPFVGRGTASDTKIAFTTSAIELSVAAGTNSMSAAQLNARLPESYVAESEISIEPGSEVTYLWALRQPAVGAQRGYVTMNLDTAREAVFFNYWDGANINSSLAGPFVVQGMQAGRRFVVSVVIAFPSYTVYIDQKQVARFTESRIANGVSFMEINNQNGTTGTVRVSRLGYYQVAAP